MNSRAKWKPVVGYEGLYEVSDRGDVKSLPKYNYKTERILKQVQNPRDGRMTVMLCRSPEDHKRKFVHRLVAEAFIENPQGFIEINHKDENPQNNNVENLEWCGRQYNMTYGKMQELHRSRRRPVRAHFDFGTIYFKSIAEAVKSGTSRSSIMHSLRTGNPVSGVLWEYDNEHK